MTPGGCLTFPLLQQSGLQHFFSLRANNPVELAALLENLASPPPAFVRAEQIHGNAVAVVDSADAGRCIPGVDALITRCSGLALVIRVADCGPLYFYDPVARVIALAHSGRKGTEQNIAGHTVRKMTHDFGTRPENLTVVLGPCIRPPQYEVDFAGEIRRQLLDAGVQRVDDCGLNTASDPARFYSYRMEKGNTGRHHAVLRMV